MTGDGVNDALALKDADIGVAMGNGAQATKAVAELVLLDGRFSHLPDVLAEGRRVIGNVERVANLFVAKNAMSLVAILAAALTLLPFPFLPRHLTLVSAVTIGIPAFFLALGPNKRRYLPGFLGRILRFAVPAGAIAGLAVIASYLLAGSSYGVPPDEFVDAVRASRPGTRTVDRRRVLAARAPARRSPCSSSSSGSSSCWPGHSGRGRRASSARWSALAVLAFVVPDRAHLLQLRRARASSSGSRSPSAPSGPPSSRCCTGGPSGVGRMVPAKGSACLLGGKVRTHLAHLWSRSCHPLIPTAGCSA